MTPLLQIFLLVLITSLNAGCAKLEHIDQLLTLRNLSVEQDQIGKQIKRQDAQFDRLVAVVQQGKIARYKSQKSVLSNFGKPVIISQTNETDVWMYRYSAQFFNSPKVYLCWNKSGQLIRWNYETSQDKGNPSKSL